MGDQEQLQRLKRSVAEWNQWRRQHPNLCPDLSGADLSDANLSDTDLSWADLSGADLNDANLSNADLIVANLSNANLSNATLHGATLHGATLHGADLRGVDLSWLDLRGINLSRANLSGVDLHGAKLSEADLSGADLNRAKLRGVDLRGINLSGAKLSGADLSGAKPNGVNLQKADLRLENMYYTILKGSDKGNMTYSFSVSVIEKGIYFEETSDYFAKDDGPGMEMNHSLLIPPSSFDALLRLLMKRCQLELSLPERSDEKFLLLKNLLARLDASSGFYKPGRGSGGANLGLLSRWLAEEGIPYESSHWVY